MNTKIIEWPINEAFNQRAKIHEQPKYQRGEVWKLKKKQMLVDSILRGIDIPKIYFRKLHSALHEYEVADGQQRLTALFKFKNNDFPLSSESINGLDLSKIGRFVVGNKYYRDLNATIKKKFDDYKLTIAVVEDATNEEIRTLFGRLQMGDPLIPAEIRNAIISQLGIEIDNIALNHNFFGSCRIPSTRYKHQDYLTHLFALIHYNNSKNLKAPLLQELYFDLHTNIPQHYIADTVKILTHLHQIDQHSTRRIVNKWAFVDFFWFLYSNKGLYKTIDYLALAEQFDSFEVDRTANNRNPQVLIEAKKPSRYERSLYDYITAFNTDGGSPSNISKRFSAFHFLFQPFLKK
jgi:hypothetical protein